MERSARNAQGETLVIDGTAEDGTLQGDGMDAPFYVFNVEKQANVAGPFPFMWMARIWLTCHTDTRNLKE